MAKKRKSKSEKELARLRREVEILRAQLPKEKVIKPVPQRSEKEPEQAASKAETILETSDIPVEYIKKGLKKTFLLTLLAAAILAGLSLYQSHKLSFLN